MIESARPAQPDDLPAIVALGTRARDELRPFRGGELWANREAVREPLTSSYGRMYDLPTVRFVVGLLDDVVLGFGLGELEDLADGRPLGRISEIFVDAEARGVGLGEAIVGELLGWFDAHDCVGVDAVALPGHRQAKNFFEGHGFVARLLVMHHRSQSDDPA
jgi:ribosomal protein S18 acetylase RimI-like enzyme